MTAAIELTPPAPLTVLEIGQLKHYEAIVERNERAVMEGMDALLEVHDRNLYREYGTFPEYIAARFPRLAGLHRSRIYQKLDEARETRNITAAVSTMVDNPVPLPASGRSMRAFAQSDLDDQEKVDVYVDVARDKGRAPTGREIEEAIARRAEANPDSSDEDERAAAFLAAASPKANLRVTAPPPPRILTRGPAQLANERYTDPIYIEAARRVLGAIDVDPASCDEANEVVKAGIFFDEDTNGLGKHWFGRVYLNPPYGVDEDRNSNMGRWSAELVDQYEADIVTAAILCVNALPWAPWWKRLVDFPVCLTNHRPIFRKPRGAEPDKHGPPNGNAFFYLGPDVDAFVREFDQFGPIYGRLKPARSN